MVYAYVSMVVMLLAVAAGVCTVLLFMMASTLLRPPRMSDAKATYLLKRLSPNDLGLPFEPHPFEIRDHADGKPLRLTAWWIPAEAPSGRTVLILHGYSDAKVGGIAWAPVWRSLGWNVLALDLRAHGESGGKHSTAGYFEREDVDQVIEQLRHTRPRATEQIAIFGVSLGAAVAAAVAARRDDLRAIILESPYSDYRVAIASHGRRLAMPLEWGYGLATRIGEWLSGAQFAQVRPLDLIPRIHAPLLVIHAGADTFVSRAEIDQINDAIARREAPMVSQRAIVDDSQHTRSLLSDPHAYRERLRAFLAQTEPVLPAPAQQAQPAEAQ